MPKNNPDLIFRYLVIFKKVGRQGVSGRTSAEITLWYELKPTLLSSFKVFTDLAGYRIYFAHAHPP
jgi:hypothetical protein